MQPIDAKNQSNPAFYKLNEDHGINQSSKDYEENPGQINYDMNLPEFNPRSFEEKVSQDDQGHGALIGRKKSAGNKISASPLDVVGGQYASVVTNDEHQSKHNISGHIQVADINTLKANSRFKKSADKTAENLQTLNTLDQSFKPLANDESSLGLLNQGSVYGAKDPEDKLPDIESHKYSYSKSEKQKNSRKSSKSVTKAQQYATPSSTPSVCSSHENYTKIDKKGQKNFKKRKRKLSKQVTKVYGTGKNQKLAGFQSFASMSKSSLFKESAKFGSFMKSNTIGASSLNESQSNEVTSNLGMSQFSQVQKSEETSLDLRSVFIENYGVSMEMPVYYHLDAKFVPHFNDYIVSMGFHIIPKRSKQMYTDSEKNVQTTYIDGRVEYNSLDEIYDNTGENLILNLYKQNGRNGFEKQREILLEEAKQSIMMFSTSGHHFGIYIIKEKLLNVFDSTDINTCFDLISEHQPLLQVKVEDPEFKNAQRLLFDKRDRYVILQSLDQVIVYSLMPHNLGETVQSYRIDGEQYSNILDTMFDSGVDINQYRQMMKDDKKMMSNQSDATSTYNEVDYMCQIACKHIGITGVHIFDINAPRDFRNISYMENSGTLIVKISNDFQSAILSNGSEHYMLKGRSQSNFPNIKDKILRRAVNKDDHFFLITSKEYDRDIDILHSAEEEFNASIVRAIEPGLLKIQDSIIIPDGDLPENERAFSGNMKVLSKLGDHIYVDTIDIDKCFDDDPTNSVIDTCVDKFYYAYGFNWPYFSFATKHNNIYIFNAFNKNFIQRYELPEHVSIITHTFLTDTHDFFVTVETKERNFEVFTLDLDSADPLIQGPILQYPFEKVGGKQITGIHVRGSSRKEKINLNKQLMIFMMHGHDLWGWNSRNFEKLSENAFNMYYMSDDQFFYMNTNQIQLMIKGKEKTIEHSKIKTVQCLFGGFKIGEIYEDPDQKAEILNFGVDNTKKRLIILTGIKNAKEKRDKFVTIFDLNSESQLVSLKIMSREIIGRLKTNLYNFVGGHIYYNNKVIKVRYDLLEQFRGGEIKENQLFDHYSEVINLKSKNNKVMSGMPLQTCLYNRLAYIVKNSTELNTGKLLILPYLHERRIYLNRRHTANHFYSIHQKDESRYILCLCINDNKMYVYTETGILCDRIKYNHIVRQCGRPESIGENGKFVLFTKCGHSTDVHIVEVTPEGLDRVASIDVTKRLKQYIENMLLVQNSKEKSMKMKGLKDGLKDIKDKSKQGLKGIKDKRIANIKSPERSRESKQEGEETEEYENRIKVEQERRSTNQSYQIEEFYKKYLKQMKNMKQINCSYNMNDAGDVLIRIKPTKEAIYEQKKEIDAKKNVFGYDEDDEKESLFNCSLFYYIPNPQGKNQANEEYLYFDSQYDIITELQGASMNDGYIFFWNLGKVWSLNLENHQLKRLNLYISEKEVQTYVKRVRCGSNKNQIAIRVTQSPLKDCIIYWNLIDDLEISSFDVDTSASTFQDKDGNPYIVDRNYIVNCKQGCRLKCYQVDAQELDENSKNCKFQFQYGHRVETESHNWMIFRNYINLSFSYMTFVIKENFEQNSFAMEDFLFDVEGYDYILNRNTIFTEGSLVKKDYEKLRFILQHYNRLDPTLLESLHYMTTNKKIPLHLALEANNNRMVNLILEYMAKIDYAAVDTIKDVFKLLINFQAFENYLGECPFQTKQMQNKQTLRMLKTKRTGESDEIVSCSRSSLSYVDDVYFKECMNEDIDNPKSLTYAVKINCVRADWIINGDEGYDFLQELLRQENKNIFLTPYVMIVIEFLYGQYSDRIKKMLMPPFIMHLFAIVATLWTTQFYRSHLDLKFNEGDDFEINLHHEEQMTEENLTNMKRAETAAIISKVICTIINFLNMGVFIKQSLFLKRTQFKRGWAYLDLSILICNFIITLSMFMHINIEFMRCMEAFLILFIMMKSLYFLRLIKQIAPLVDIIMIILADIKYFMVIFCIAEFAFICAYYLIGKNQEQIALAEGGNEDDIPGYATLMGAFNHVYSSSLGEFDTDFYFGNPMTPILVFLFIGLSFFMCLHMLNMLIAIMGDSFSNNNEHRESKAKMSQLAFVVDNWWIDPIKNREKIIYLIAAFKLDAQKNQNQDEKFEDLHGRIDGLEQSQNNIMSEVKKLQFLISQMKNN